MNYTTTLLDTAVDVTEELAEEVLDGVASASSALPALLASAIAKRLPVRNVVVAALALIAVVTAIKIFRSRSGTADEKAVTDNVPSMQRRSAA